MWKRIVLYAGGGAAALVVLSVAVLWAMSLRPDAGVTRAVVQIDRPQAAIWRWIEEPDRFAKWVDWVVKVEDDGDPRVGARRRVVVRDPNMGNQELDLFFVTTHRTPPQLLRARVSSPIGFDGTTEYRLEDMGRGRTRLTITGRFQYTKWLFQLMEPIITPDAQAKEQSDAERLKRLVESEPAQ